MQYQDIKLFRRPIPASGSKVEMEKPAFHTGHTKIRGRAAQGRLGGTRNHQAAPSNTSAPPLLQKRAPPMTKPVGTFLVLFSSVPSEYLLIDFWLILNIKVQGSDGRETFGSCWTDECGSFPSLHYSPYQIKVSVKY